jgi:DNA-binding CsgD family transcriptional regulator
VDLQQLADPETRELIWPRACDRLVVAGRSRHNTYSISLVREGQRNFSSAAIRNVGHFAELMVALVDKHMTLMEHSQEPYRAMGTLAEIAERVEGAKKFTQREGAVCARILYGMTTAGIALDLGVSPETVKSFRKLVYRRLGIGSSRELLQWYLSTLGRCSTS